MDAELFDNWLKDLRTTDTPQGKGYLRSTDGDCCLGRLCEVSGLGKWVKGNNVWEYEVDGLYILTDLMGPELDLADKLGFPEDVMHTCIDYNDSQRIPFAQIADKLEEMRDYIVGYRDPILDQEDS